VFAGGFQQCYRPHQNKALKPFRTPPPPLSLTYSWPGVEYSVRGQ
jgi:hypothetical protein